MSETQEPRRFLTPQRLVRLCTLLPWTGLACIFLGFGCGIAALVIGLVSDKMPQNSWTLPTGVVQPSVMLSVTATLANAFLRAAFTEGAVIAWWVQAHQGVSVATLQASYDHAHTFMGLFTAFLKPNKVIVASLAMMLLLLDGPFLQRASFVQIISHMNVTKLSIPVSPSPFGLGATGIITTHDGAEPDLYTQSFVQVAKDYNAGVPFSIPTLDDPGTVTMDLIAPGFDVSCINGSSNYRLMSVDEYEEAQTCGNCSFPAYSQTMFSIVVDFFQGYTPFFDPAINYAGLQYGISLNSSYKSTPGGNGTLSWRNCNLKEALIRYPLRIDNGTVVIQPMPLSENRTQQLIMRREEINGMGGNTPSTIGGLWIVLNNLYQTSANVTCDPVAPYRMSNENAAANQFFAGGDITSYDVTWADPTDTMITALHELTLRAAIALTSESTSTQPEVMYPNLTFVNRSISQEAAATIVSTGPIYHTEFSWLLSGFLMILLACLALTPLYWAWWRLERSFTLNPLEVSKAFDAPLLRLASTDIQPGAWSGNLRSMRIQYGVVTATEELMFNDATDAKVAHISDTMEGGVRKFRKVE